MLQSSTLIDTNDAGLHKRKRSPSKERLLDNFKDEGTALTIKLSPRLATKKPRFLRIDIPSALNSGLENIKDSEDVHSLFSSSDIDSLFDDIDAEIISTLPKNPAETDEENILATRTSPPIPGLFFEPSVILPQELADEVVSFCLKTYFLSPADNQVMLFGRFLPPSDPSSKSSSGFPQILLNLLEKVSHVLQPVIPSETHALLFPTQPTRARQAIINLYQPGEGITPHVDLLGRYGDGIIGVSFSSGSVMRFDKVDPGEGDTQTRWDVYLPERSIIVLSEDARYNWTHGIDKKKRDFVSELEGSGHDNRYSTGSGWINRGTRISVTFRWLLPGADVVGNGS